RSDFPLLLGALEVEPRDERARRNGLSADLQLVFPAGNLFPHALVRVERVAALIDVAELHRLAEPQRSAVGLLLSRDHPEQRRLARTVGADDADDAAARQRERE